MEKVTRRKEEFYCSECNKYFLTYLRNNMTGQYTIQCPNCKHHHFRVVTEGLVTSDRCNHLANQLDIIVGLKATLKDTPWHNDPHFRRGQMRTV